MKPNKLIEDLFKDNYSDKQIVKVVSDETYLSKKQVRIKLDKIKNKLNIKSKNNDS